MNVILNGQRRPNLNDQINRLDRILDGLADGLNESVATAVQTAVQLAVKQATETVLRELLTGPAALPALAAAKMPTESKPTLLQRVGRGRRQLWQRTVAIAKALPSTIRRSIAAFGQRVFRIPGTAHRAAMTQASRTVATLAGMVLVAWRLRRTVPIAVTAGLGAAALGYSATPALAAVLHGATIAALTIIARLMAPTPLPRFALKKP